MTEQKWLSATDRTAMLDFLKRKASKRKLRLFAVGCSRRICAILNAAQNRMFGVAGSWTISWERREDWSTIDLGR